MKLLAKSLAIAVVIQGFLLLALFLASTFLPEDDVITDGVHFIIVSFMPAVFYLITQNYESPNSPVIILTIYSCVDVLIYTMLIWGFLWWRRRQREASQAESRALRIT
jgi:hypothetical protein